MPSPTDPRGKPDPSLPLPLEISATEAASLLRTLPAAGRILLDCRTPEEHATSRIEDAILIPMHDLPQRGDELEPFRGGTVIVHCHHGVRSLRVVQWLRDRGFAGATSMRGGIEAWSTEVDPSVPTY